MPVPGGWGGDKLLPISTANKPWKLALLGGQRLERALLSPLTAPAPNSLLNLQSLLMCRGRLVPFLYNVPDSQLSVDRENAASHPWTSTSVFVPAPQL